MAANETFERTEETENLIELHLTAAVAVMVATLDSPMFDAEPMRDHVRESTEPKTVTDDGAAV
jgi:hypothetical protein